MAHDGRSDPSICGPRTTAIGADSGRSVGRGLTGQIDPEMVYRGGCGSRLDDEYASPFVTMSDRGRRDHEHRGRSDEMAHFVGLDVSVKETSVCVVDDTGKAILEQKVPTEPADIIALLSSLGVTYGRIGIEAGPLSQWLVNALTATSKRSESPVWHHQPEHKG